MIFVTPNATDRQRERIKYRKDETKVKKTKYAKNDAHTQTFK